MSDIAAKGSPDNRQLAHDLLDMGEHVIPCRGKDENPPGRNDNKGPKSPKLGKVGVFEMYAKDHATIDRWWDQWPDAVPGLICGSHESAKDVPSGWSRVVIDVDTKNDGVAKFRQRYGEPTALCRHVIWSQGGDGACHLHYKAPTKWADRIGQRDLISDCVNTRMGAHGYVIAPGAVMADGRSYDWADPAAAGSSFDDLDALLPIFIDALDPPLVDDDLEPDLEPDAQVGGNLQGGKIPEDKKGQKGAKTSPAGFSSKATVLPFKGNWTPSDGQLALFDRLCSTPAAKGERSTKFADAVWFAKKCGISPREVIDAMQSYPQGVSAKYRPPNERKNRIKEEVERAWDRPEAPAFASFRPTVNLDLKSSAKGSSTGSGASVSRETFERATVEPEAAFDPKKAQFFRHEAQTMPDDQRWLLDRIFPLATLGFINGRGSVGKTRMAIHFFLGYAYGEEEGRFINSYHNRPLGAKLAPDGGADDEDGGDEGDAAEGEVKRAETPGDPRRAVTYFGNRLSAHGSALYVTGEDGGKRFSRMVREIDPRFDGSVDEKLAMICLTDHRVIFEMLEQHPRLRGKHVKTENWQRFETFLREKKAADPSFGLLGLDSFVVLAGVDTSDNMAAKDVARVLNNLCSELQINIVVLNHTTKSGSDTKATSADRERNDSLGSATVVNQARGVVSLRPLNEDDAKEVAKTLNTLWPEGVGERASGAGSVRLVRPRDLVKSLLVKTNDDGDQANHIIVLEPGSGIPHGVTWAKPKSWRALEAGEEPQKVRRADKDRLERMRARQAAESACVEGCLAAIAKMAASGAPIKRGDPFGEKDKTLDIRAHLKADLRGQAMVKAALQSLLNSGRIEVAAAPQVKGKRGVSGEVYLISGGN
jgi:hypothetical protein